MFQRYSKTLVKKLKMRNLIFNNREISRQELIRLTGFTNRTVDRYAANLKAQGLIFAETRAEHRGHPSIIYKSNSENICFISISLIETRLCFQVIDINSYLIHSHISNLAPNAPASDIIRVGHEGLKQIRARFSNLAIAAAGFNFSTYHQKRNYISAFRRLMQEIQRRYDINVDANESTAWCLLRIYESLALTGRVGTLIPGDEIRLHVVDNGMVCEDLGNYLNKYKHHQLDQHSSYSCTCGRHGCINSLLTYKSTIQRYYDLLGSEPGNQSLEVLYNNFILQGEAGESAACKILKENGVLTAKALTILKEELHLDQLVLFNCASPTYVTLTKEYHKKTNNTHHLLNFRLTVSDSSYAAAELMRQRFLNYKF